MESKEESIEIDVQLDKGTLNRFLLRNNFLRTGGVVGVLISAAAIVCLAVFWNYFVIAQKVVLLFLALMFTVIQPVTLLMKGWEQLKKGAFREPFHYTFTPEGIEVINIAGTANVEWEQIRRVVVTKDAMYIYMTAVSALIISRKECDGRYTEIAEMVREHTR